MTATDLFILLSPALILLLVGFGIGRISTAPQPLPRFPLSNAALAHIVYEAIRSYERSIGVIKKKSWNNLEVWQRACLTDRVRKLRNREAVAGYDSPIANALESAIATLVK